MSNYTDRYALATSGTLRAQVRVALLTAATNISTEDAGTDFHKPRRVFAVQVLKNPDSFAPAFAAAVAAWPAINTDAAQNTDDTIQFIVDSLWNSFAVSDDSNPTGAVSTPPVSAKPVQ